MIFIYGIILLIIGGLNIYSLEYSNNIYNAYLLVLLGTLSLIAGAYFSEKSRLSPIRLWNNNEFRILE
ncbi:MAG: hypothetical protein KAJ44_04115 [Thermoplasmatales archaeon]|nr:hypothetical protein [Thermoplasmatales archaeon]